MIETVKRLEQWLDSLDRLDQMYGKDYTNEQINEYKTIAKRKNG